MIVIDVEASGLYAEKYSILSIGAIDFYNPKNEFYSECGLWEGAEIDLEALNVNGFSVEDISNPTKESPEILLKAFISWAETVTDRTLAGLSPARLDLDFLEDTAHRFNIDWNFSSRTIDVHALVYSHLKRREEEVPMKNNHSNIHSHFIQTYCGLPPHPHPHHALTDAKWEAESISRIIYGKNLLEEYKDYKIPDYLL